MARHIPRLVFIFATTAALACSGPTWVVVHTGDFGPGIATVSGRLDDPHGPLSYSSL
jgi:hypothetical protein